MAGQFGISLKELRELMEVRGPEAVDRLKQLNGAQELCKKLRTSEATGKIMSNIIINIS